MKPASEATLPIILKGLCLPVFARECTPLATRAVREGLSHEEYLLALAEQEASERAERRVERLLVESKLPRDKSLAGFIDLRGVDMYDDRADPSNGGKENARTLLQGDRGLFIDK